MKYLIKNLFILGMIAIPTVTKGQIDTCHCSLLKFYKKLPQGGDFYEKRVISDSLITYKTPRYFKDSFSNIYLLDSGSDTLMREGNAFFQNGFVVFSPDSFKLGKPTSSYRFTKSPFNEYGHLTVSVYKPAGKMGIENGIRYFPYIQEVYVYTKPRLLKFDFYEFPSLNRNYLMLQNTYNIRFNPFYGIIQDVSDSSNFMLDLDYYILIDGPCPIIRSRMEKAWFGNMK